MNLAISSWAIELICVIYGLSDHDRIHKFFQQSGPNHIFIGYKFYRFLRTFP